MEKNTGSKISLGEYTARAAIDVTAKVAAPIITLAAGYIVYFHGSDISQAIRTKINNRKKR